MAKGDKDRSVKSLADLAKLLPKGDTTPRADASDIEVRKKTEEEAFGELCSLASIQRDSDTGAVLRKAVRDAYYDSDAVIHIRDILESHDVKLVATTGPIHTFFEDAKRSRTELGSMAPVARVRNEIARDPLLQTLPADEMCKLLGFELTHRHASQLLIYLRQAEASKEGFEQLVSFLKKTKNWNFNRAKEPFKKTLDAWRKRYGIPMQE